jgi:hypothetical protein
MIKPKQLIQLCGLILVALLFLNVCTQVQGLLQVSASVSSSGTITNSTIPWLHTSGQNIYDQNNNQIKLYTCVIQDGDGNTIKQTDVQNIKNMGFKAIRFFIYIGQITPTNPSTVNTAYFSTGTGEPSGTAIDNLVKWCNTSGLYIMLCPCWTPTWDLPSWAKVSGGPTGCADGGSATTLETLQPGINTLYTFLATRYGSYSNIIFESINELTTTIGNAQFTYFPTFNNGWVSAIEANEGATSHLKVIQMMYDWSSYNYPSLTSKSQLISGSHNNILCCTHDYPMVDGTQAQAADWANHWATAIHNIGLPWIDTEFSTALGGTYTNLGYAISYYTQYNVAGWGYFCYDSQSSAEGNYNIKNPTNAASILPILNMT